MPETVADTHLDPCALFALSNALNNPITAPQCTYTLMPDADCALGLTLSRLMLLEII